MHVEKSSLGGLAGCKWGRTQTMPHGHSASCAQQKNFVSTYYMQNTASSAFILSWQQCIVAETCTDPPLNAMLPQWHDMRKMTFHMLTLLSNVNSIAVSLLEAK
jgi:hypothetical protein